MMSYDSNYTAPTRRRHFEKLALIFGKPTRYTVEYVAASENLLGNIEVLGHWRRHQREASWRGRAHNLLSHCKANS